MSQNDLVNDLLPYAEWVKRESAKKVKPGERKLRKMEDVGGAKQNEIFHKIQEIVRAALANYPNDSDFVAEKINCILHDPNNFHLYYGSVRVKKALKFLKKVGKMQGDAYGIYQKIYLYCIRRSDCVELTQELILMAPQEGDLQLRLVQEYIRLMTFDEFGKPLNLSF